MGNKLSGSKNKNKNIDYISRHNKWVKGETIPNDFHKYLDNLTKVEIQFIKTKSSSGDDIAMTNLGVILQKGLSGYEKNFKKSTELLFKVTSFFDNGSFLLRCSCLSKYPSICLFLSIWVTGSGFSSFSIINPVSPEVVNTYNLYSEE